MNTKLFNTILGILVSVCLVAQETPQTVTQCGINEATEQLLKSHPELTDEIRLDAQRLQEETENFTSEKKLRDDAYIIPVVFHVIHTNDLSNISDEQIFDAMRTLNEDFNAGNSNIGLVNEAFADIVADVGIEFRLAQRDPDGNCTNGIIRTYDVATYTGGENLKEVSPIWDRSRYLNIWTCQSIESGAAGYSYYPSSMDNSFGLLADGIVVRSDYVGTIGTSALSHGHTLSHEAGHWLNLAHTWGSTNEPGEESNCSSDDGVSDTPNTIGWTSCNLNGWSCGSLDNVENFMEYSYCGKMFTLGQANRMLAALNSTISNRNNLWSEENMIFTGVLENPEICLVDFEVNKNIICVGEPVLFEDRSFNGITGRQWEFAGADTDTSLLHSPEVVYSQPGVYPVKLTVWNETDTVSALREDFLVVLDTAAKPIPYAENFEAMVELGGIEDWHVQPAGDAVNWKVNHEIGYSGSSSAYVQGRFNTEGETEKLMSTTFEAAGLVENASLSFRYAYGKRIPNPTDELRVFLSRDCGDQWLHRLTITGAELATVEGIVSGEFQPTDSTQWRQVFINTITFPYWTNSFRIKFEFVSGHFSNNIYLDDINIVDDPTLAIAQKDLFDELVIYPNPTSAEFFIAGNFSTSSKMEIALYDVSGRLIKQLNSAVFTPGDNEIGFDVSDIANGLYLLKISDGSSAITKKIRIE